MNTEISSYPPLSRQGIREFLAARSESLTAVIAYLEAGEYWVLDFQGGGVEASLKSLNDRMDDPAPAPIYDPADTGYVLSYLSAGRTVRLLEWLEANPLNTVVSLLDNPDIDIAFKSRLRAMLKILSKAVLLHALFGPTRQREILACLGTH